MATPKWRVLTELKLYGPMETENKKKKQPAKNNGVFFFSFCCYFLGGDNRTFANYLLDAVSLCF